MKTLLIIFIVLIVSLVQCSVYEIEETPNESGLIIEKGPFVKLIRGHWKIVHFIDVSELENLVEKLFTGINVLTEKCYQRSQTQTFIPHLDLLSIKLNKIINITKSINSILDNRPKRSAPLSIISAISRSLFGTLNEEDLNEINYLITENTNKINSLSKVISDQTIIMKKNFEDIHSTLHKMQQIYNDTTEKIIRLQNITLSNQLMITNLNESISIMNSVALASSFINNLKDDFDIIFQATLFAKEGTLHPSLLTKEKLFEIAKSSFTNKQDEKYPLKDMNSFDNFKKLIKLNMYVEKGKLLYVILIPFTNNQNYSIYSVSPQIVNLTLGFGYIKPFSKFYIVHDKYQIYIPLTKDEYDKCKFMENNRICFNTYIYKKLNSDSPCELQLIFNKEIKNIEKCDIRITKENKSHWTKSLDLNKIYYTVPTEETIKITCNKVETMATIKNSGILKLSEKCQIESKDYQYKTPRTRTFISSSTILPSINLDIVKKLLNITHFHDNKINIEGEQFLFIDNMDKDFGVSSTKLNDIIKRTEEISTHVPLHKHVAISIGVPSISIISIILLTSIFTYNKLKSRNNRDKEIKINLRSIKSMYTEDDLTNIKSNQF